MRALLVERRHRGADVRDYDERHLGAVLPFPFDTEIGHGDRLGTGLLHDAAGARDPTYRFVPFRGNPIRYRPRRREAW